MPSLQEVYVATQDATLADVQAGMHGPFGPNFRLGSDVPAGARFDGVDAIPALVITPPQHDAIDQEDF